MMPKHGGPLEGDPDFGNEPFEVREILKDLLNADKGDWQFIALLNDLISAKIRAAKEKPYE